MRRRFLRILEWAYRRLLPKPVPESSEVHVLREALAALYQPLHFPAADAWSFLAPADRVQESLAPASDIRLRETIPAMAQGAFGDIELALANVEWRREINLSWLEFSRWGIQQIIYISRLYAIKHPWIQRGVNLSAVYVFGRGVEISSEDERINATLEEIVANNPRVFGNVALCDQERSKSTDGNLFWVAFPDKVNTGQVQFRNIDPTEIQEIITNPEDSSEAWYYQRCWTRKRFDPTSGTMATESAEAWYPAMGYEPAAGERQEMIHGKPVMWDMPVYHRKCGGIAGWKFGCPRVYAALDWSKAGRRFLEACATVRQALSTIAMTLTTKGGQAALEGAKQQLQTTVGPGGGQALWDTNPPPVNASIFASGPGTKLEAFSGKANCDPGEVKEFRNMVACTLEIPPTWLGDMETSNLSTALTLDRPTELGFMRKQEEWIEDLTFLLNYALSISAAAPSGKLREAATNTDDDRQVRVTFPAIREGDIPAQIDAVIKAMTLGSRPATPGIDKTAGRKLLYRLLDIQDGEVLAEEQEKAEEEEEMEAPEVPQPGIAAAPPLPTEEEVQEALRRVQRAAATLRGNGHTSGSH